LEYSGGGEHKKLKEFQVFKLEGGQWKRIRYKKADAQNWYGNLESFNKDIYMIYGWQHLQKYNGTDWIDLPKGNDIAPPPAKKSYSYYPHLQFDKNGIVYAVWQDASYIKEGYLKGGSWLSCSKLDGGKWMWVGKRAFGKDCGRPLLSISDNKLYVLFKDYDAKIYIDYRSTLSMMVCENDKWSYLGKRGFSPGNISGTSLDFAVYNGVPYALFTYEDKWTGSYKERTNQITLMKFENNSWLEVGKLQTQGAIYHLHLKFSKTGVPHVAYVDNFKKIRVRKFNGTNWEDLGVLGTKKFNGPLGQNQWPRSYQVKNLFFDLSENDVPYVAFTQTSRIKTKSQTGDKAFEQIFVYRYTKQ